MRMIHNPKWRLGFIMGALLLLWDIVFSFILAPQLEMGPGLGIWFLMVGVFILMALLMLLFVFFRQTRPLSFGLAVPLLVFQIVLIIQTYGWNSPYVPVNLAGCIALLVVGIVYVSKGRRSGGQLNTIE